MVVVVAVTDNARGSASGIGGGGGKREGDSLSSSRVSGEAMMPFLGANLRGSDESGLCGIRHVEGKRG